MKKTIAFIIAALLAIQTAQAIVTSGTTPVGTSGDAAVTLIPASGIYTRILIQNYGTTPGYFSVDAGANWTPLPAGGTATPSVISLPMPVVNAALMIKRIAGGADLSGVYATEYSPAP